MPLYIVDTIASYRIRYVIEAKEQGHAYDEVVCNGADGKYFEEVTQKYLGESIIDGREITKEQYDQMLKDLAESKEENGSHWMGDALIRRIDYHEDEPNAE